MTATLQEYGILDSELQEVGEMYATLEDGIDSGFDYDLDFDLPQEVNNSFDYDLDFWILN